jgi:hypothetical protein
MPVCAERSHTGPPCGIHTRLFDTIFDCEISVIAAVALLYSVTTGYCRVRATHDGIDAR